ncbi:MAG: RHS repeat-associated core domain-containing protein, partial [Bacteroidetes bacterium]|nr:RHS repeat-associated core domain-containing protein [Bacteroidota bacterium]
ANHGEAQRRRKRVIMTMEFTPTFCVGGARYYDSDVGIWMSVDPLAHLRPGLSPYQYAQNNPLLRIDPTGMLDENGNEDDKDKQNWFQKMWSIIGQLTSSSENTESQSGNPIVDSDEMTGMKKVAEVSEKAKQNVVEGIDNVHDVASTTSGVAAVGALSTTGTPASPVLATTSSAAGYVAAGASFTNWLITGDSKYLNNLKYEVSTFGIGAGSQAIKAGKTLTPSNVKILQDVYRNNINAMSWGIGYIRR